MSALGGASIEYTARGHRVGAREAALRRPDARRHGDERGGRARPGAGADPGDPLLGRRVRGPDGWRGPCRRDLAALVAALPEGYKEDYTPGRRVKDLSALLALDDVHDMSMAMYVPDRPDDEAELAAEDLPARGVAVTVERSCRTCPCSAST
mgnify:CR=1 FL=1